MNDFLSLAPIRIFKFLKEFLLYSVIAAFKRWWLFSIIFILVAIPCYLITPHLASLYNYLYFFIFPFTAVIFLSIKSDFKETKFTGQFTVGELECIYITDNDYFEKNLITDKLNEESKTRIQKLFKNSYPFKIGIAKYKLITYPKFYYYLVSPKTLYSKLQAKVDLQEFQCIIQIIIDSKTSSINVKFYSQEQTFTHIKVIHEIGTAVSRMDVKERDIEHFVGDILSFYQSIISHGSLELMINVQAYDNAHRLLDENQQTIKKSLKTLQEYVSADSIKLIQSIETIWECEIERYRAIVFMLTGSFHSALIHLFKAIKINPYYPFDNYDLWKSEFEKRYAMDFTDHLEVAGNDILEIDSSIEDGELNSTEEIKAAFYSASSQLSFPGIISYTDLLLDIINQAQSKEINDEIELIFKDNICASPMQEYIKGEVFKYIPIEGDTINKLYVGRIDVACALFTTVLEMAPTFPLIHNKIGSLELFKVMSMGEEAGSADHSKWKYHMDRAFEVFTKFGLRYKGGKS